MIDRKEENNSALHALSLDALIVEGDEEYDFDFDEYVPRDGNGGNQLEYHFEGTSLLEFQSISFVPIIHNFSAQLG